MRRPMKNMSKCARRCSAKSARSSVRKSKDYWKSRSLFRGSRRPTHQRSRLRNHLQVRNKLRKKTSRLKGLRPCLNGSFNRFSSDKLSSAQAQVLTISPAMEDLEARASEQLKPSRIPPSSSVPIARGNSTRMRRRGTSPFVLRRPRRTR
jgi:hypothetical protein